MRSTISSLVSAADFLCVNKTSSVDNQLITVKNRLECADKGRWDLISDTVDLSVLICFGKLVQFNSTGKNNHRVRCVLLRYIPYIPTTLSHCWLQLQRFGFDLLVYLKM